ncbi:unnamed protein product [Amaranthus hypochondriacus]
MMKLNNLCLLDLRECKISSGGLPAKVLSRLNQLEGLYMTDGIKEYGWLDELNNLSHMKELELTIFKPLEEKFVKNLDKFKILIRMDYCEFLEHASCYNVSELWENVVKECSSILAIGEEDVCSLAKKYKCIEALLVKCDALLLNDVKGMDEFVDHHLENGSLKGVKHLYIT